MMKEHKELHWLMKKDKNEEFFSLFPIFRKYRPVLWLTTKCCTSDQQEALSNQQTRLEVKKKSLHSIRFECNQRFVKFPPTLIFLCSSPGWALTKDRRSLMLALTQLSLSLHCVHYCHKITHC